MEIWCDSANTDLITKYLDMGIYGITTNPKLLNLENSTAQDTIQDLLSIPSLPIAVQLTNQHPSAMYNEALQLRDISRRIYIKVPLTKESISLITRLTKQSIPVIATCLFSSMQALLAFHLGVEYVAPYIRRMQNEGENALEDLAKMQSIIQNYGFKTKILAASLPGPDYLVPLACMNIAAVTLSPGCLDKWCLTHPKTVEALSEFDKIPAYI